MRGERNSFLAARLAPCFGSRSPKGPLNWWSGTGSSCRPSAFQVNRAKRCARPARRTSLTSGTALGGRCNVHASRTQNTPSTRQDNDPTQDHRDRRWRDHDRHPVGARRWPVRTVPTPRATRRIPASQRPSGERRQLARQIIPAVSATARAHSRYARYGGSFLLVRWSRIIDLLRFGTDSKVVGHRLDVMSHLVRTAR